MEYLSMWSEGNGKAWGEKPPKDRPYHQRRTSLVVGPIFRRLLAPRLLFYHVGNRKNVSLTPNVIH